MDCFLHGSNSTTPQCSLCKSFTNLTICNQIPALWPPIHAKSQQCLMVISEGCQVQSLTSAKQKVKLKGVTRYINMAILETSTGVARIRELSKRV